MEFFDQAKIYIRSGDGGRGCISFRREKYIPMGGPDGGNGGRGGDVIFKTNPQLWTLQDFKYQQHYRAKDGKGGGGSQKTGRSAEACIVEVPLGTVIHDYDTNEVLADLVEPGQEFVVAQGGKGGRGNLEFKSSVNRAPRRFEEGYPGEERTLRLELKLLADVALVGFPNAGKSTLVSAVSAASCKAGDYPFTTLNAQLGRVNREKADGTRDSFVVADIPGLIEGAHLGKGLGIRFLKHIERSHLLWIVIDADPSPSAFGAQDPLFVYETLLHEMGEFNPELLQKPRIIVLNKIDLEPDPEGYAPLIEVLKTSDIPYFLISASEKKGLDQLLDETTVLLQNLKAQKTALEATPEETLPPTAV